MLFLGVPKTIYVLGAAQVGNIYLKPDKGFEWTVALAWGSHDDAASRVGIWYIYSVRDNVNAPFTHPLTQPAGYPHYLGRSSLQASASYLGAGPFDVPLRLTHDQYAMFQITGLAAGKKAYIYATVYEAPENMVLDYMKKLANKLGFEFDWTKPKGF